MAEPAAAQNSSFWSFSLALYAVTGVAEACIILQDSQGVDVNLLLFVLWAGRNRRRLDSSEMRALIALTEAWRRDIVMPLRQVRRSLRTPPLAFDAATAARLRQEIKKVELESERLQQAALFAFRPLEVLGALEPAERAAAANVALYAAALGTPFEPAAVTTILAALADLPE